MKNHTPPISIDDRIQQLASLATDARSDPDARRKLADAALIFGLVNSTRVDLVLISAIGRFRHASTEALRELTRGVARENRRRAKNNKTSTEAEQC